MHNPAPYGHGRRGGTVGNAVHVLAHPWRTCPRLSGAAGAPWALAVCGAELSRQAAPDSGRPCPLCTDEVRRAAARSRHGR